MLMLTRPRGGWSVDQNEVEGVELGVTQLALRSRLALKLVDEGHFGCRGRGRWGGHRDKVNVRNLGWQADGRRWQIVIEEEVDRPTGRAMNIEPPEGHRQARLGIVVHREDTIAALQRAAATLSVLVVLAVPPLWLKKATMLTIAGVIRSRSVRR